MDNKRTEEILNSLDGLESAHADPYLYSKLMNRLSERREGSVKFIWNIALVLGVVALLNLVTLYSIDTAKTKTDDRASVIASEYQINLPTY